ncbi:MAG: hypothetical protein ACM3JH_13085 [Acidithiobacillales bacterium]
MDDALRFLPSRAETQLLLRVLFATAAGSWATIVSATIPVLLVLVVAPRLEKRFPSPGGAGTGDRA